MNRAPVRMRFAMNKHTGQTRKFPFDDKLGDEWVSVKEYRLLQAGGVDAELPDPPKTDNPVEEPVVPDDTPLSGGPDATLASLDMERQDALEILDEEGIKYADDIEDDAIAALVKDLLDDDNSE